MSQKTQSIWLTKPGKPWFPRPCAAERGRSGQAKTGPCCRSQVRWIGPGMEQSIRPTAGISGEPPTGKRTRLSVRQIEGSLVQHVEGIQKWQ